MQSICGTLLTVPAFAMSITPAKEVPPNIIVIMVDDMGWGDLECYPKGDAWGGDASISTPNINRLASEGVLCMQGYATGMVCSPSRAGMLTGRYQQKFGYYSFGEAMAPLPKDVPLLPEVLKNAGYRTGMIGKWHVSFLEGSRPMDRGFDRFFGFIGGQHDYFIPNLGQPIDNVVNGTDGYIFDQNKPVDSVDYLTAEFTGRALDFLQEFKKDSRPFFLYLAYNTPHPPLQAPWEDLEPYAAKRPNERFTSRDIVKAMVDVLDRDIGSLMESLAELGLDENTLIVFTSDNGGHDDGPGGVVQHNGGLRSRKGFYYEGGVRVPFIVRWPAGLPAGKIYNEPVSQLDIFATAAAVAGVAGKNIPKNLDGVNLIPYLTGEKQNAPHELLFWSLANRQVKWAVRSGKWKLVNDDMRPLPIQGGTKVDYQTQLYNLEDDPFETNDLASKNPETVARLTALMTGFHNSMAPSILTPALNAALEKELAERAKHPELVGWPRADGAPGHWIGAGAAVRLEAEKAAQNK